MTFSDTLLGEKKKAEDKNLSFEIISSLCLGVCFSYRMAHISFLDNHLYFTVFKKSLKTPSVSLLTLYGVTVHSAEAATDFGYALWFFFCVCVTRQNCFIRTLTTIPLWNAQHPRLYNILNTYLATVASAVFNANNHSVLVECLYK